MTSEKIVQTPSPSVDTFKEDFAARSPSSKKGNGHTKQEGTGLLAVSK